MISTLFYISTCICIFLRPASSTYTAPSQSLRTLHRANPGAIIAASENPSQGQLLLDDIISLSRRDLSPDGLATSVPVSKNGAATNLQSKERALKLRSSSYNVSGIGGYRIFTLPIFAHELSTLLTETRTDLQFHDTNTMTNFYQFNSTGWSFSVITANTSLYYASIEAIVIRFWKLSSIGEARNITSTRVGVVLNGSIPVANVLITPYSDNVRSSYVPFANFSSGHNFSTTQPTEVIKVTPFGSSCSIETVNETTELAPFLNTPTSDTLEPRSIEAHILAHLTQTVWYMTVRLWYADDGQLVQFDLAILMALGLLAIMECAIGYLMPFYALGHLIVQATGLDTGFYTLGKLATRLVMEVTRRDSQGRLISLKWETWRDLVWTLIAPLQRLVGNWGGMATNAHGWTMEGEIYGPANGDVDIGTGRNDSQVLIGRWQLWVEELGN